MDVEEEIMAILRARNAHVNLVAGTPLGGNGVGLDSISIVEVLLECEERLGVTLASDLLEGPELTVGRLIERARSLAGSR